MKTNKQKVSSLVVPSQMCFSGLVRKTSQSLFECLKLTEIEIFRLVLVMDELFMNAIQHGSNNNSSVHITYTFEEKKELIVSIEDEGTGEECTPQLLKNKMKREFQHDNVQKVSGRGLAQIALNITDDLIIEESVYGGIKVSFTKHLS